MNLEQIIVLARRLHRRGATPVAAMAAAAKIAGTRPAIVPHRLHYVQTRGGTRLVPVHGDNWRRVECERFARLFARSNGYVVSARLRALLAGISSRIQLQESWVGTDDLIGPTDVTRLEVEYWEPIRFPKDRNR